jgi:hypothetical protein
LAVLALPIPAAADVAVGDIIRGPVSRVATRGSIVVAGSVITLWGVAVPEPGQRCVSADRAEYDCSEHVRFALQLLTTNLPITCLVKETGRQRTVWAQREREGTDLGSLLVVTRRAFDAPGRVPAGMPETS